MYAIVIIMQIDEYLTDESVLKELGQRLSQLRLNRNLTQMEVARKAGITRPTIVRIENGLPTDFVSVIRVFRALDLMSEIESLVPSQSVSPIQIASLEQKRKRRQRARKPTRTQPEERGWKWGDE